VFDVEFDLWSIPYSDSIRAVHGQYDRAYGINDSSFAEWLCCIREAKLLRSCEAERHGRSPSRGQGTWACSLRETGTPVPPLL